MDQLIESIKNSREGENQELLQTAICRYRELYPGWCFVFVSIEKNATDEQGRELLKFIEEVEKKFGKTPMTF